MQVGSTSYRSIWTEKNKPGRVFIIDQRVLPFSFEVLCLENSEDASTAISDMAVRGAPLIGATAAYGLYLAAACGENLQAASEALHSSRPTAVNLRWALERQMTRINSMGGDTVRALFTGAEEIAEEDIAVNRNLGEHGLLLLEELYKRNPGRPVEIMTHCNAGWLATVDWGTATAPMYLAHEAGIPIHVWVDETRPRNQGAHLTAWELGQHGIAHTVITDNAGGHLMQHGCVDVLITGSDRTTRTGDVCNKIGTYIKALAARDNGVPFYVALPSSTIDWQIRDGLTEIPIEERDPREVSHVTGKDKDGVMIPVRIIPDGSPVANHAFDVTPARLVTGLITERGICGANEESLSLMFPERA